MGDPPGDTVERAAIAARLRASGCVFAEDEADVILASAADPGSREAMVRRRVSGEPLEYVVGWTAFAGLRVPVTHGVFVPRRRTELLVDLASAHDRPDAVVADICCGAGAIGAAVAVRRQRARIHAVDIDEAAVGCARRLFEDLMIADRATAYVGDLFRPLPPALRGGVDVIVANAPYVPTGEIAFMPAEARDHERAPALDGGVDGLALIRRIGSEAPDWLTESGIVVVEVAPSQIDGVSAVFAAAGLVPSVHRRPDIDATAVCARRGG